MLHISFLEGRYHPSPLERQKPVEELAACEPQPAVISFVAALPSGTLKIAFTSLGYWHGQFNPARSFASYHMSTLVVPW